MQRCEENSTLKIYLLIEFLHPASKQGKPCEKNITSSVIMISSLVYTQESN